MTDLASKLFNKTMKKDIRPKWASSSATMITLYDATVALIKMREQNINGLKKGETLLVSERKVQPASIAKGVGKSRQFVAKVLAGS